VLGVFRRGRLGSWIPALLPLLVACPERLLAADDTESGARAYLQGTTRLRQALGPGDVLDLDALRFTEITVSPQGSNADALVHAEGSGHFQGAVVHYTGNERLRLQRTTDGFSGAALPALEGVLVAVARRQRAIDARDGAALIALAAEDYRDGSVDRARLSPLLPTLWATVEPGAPAALAVRVDGDRASVSLRFDLDGGSRTHTLALENAAKSWRFSAGLL
jgi:hypothetical protein